MGEVRIHLDDEVGPQIQSIREAVDVGPPQTQFFWPMAHKNRPRKPLCQGICYAAGVVGGVIIHDQHRQPRQCQRQQLCDQSWQILGFIISGDNDDGLRVLGDAM